MDASSETLPRRHSPRLSGFDYSQDGGYFVTLCIQNRLPLFGKVRQGQVQLHSAGHMIWLWWAALENKFSNVITDSFIVMPDHIHGIIVLEEATLSGHPIPVGGGRPHRGAPTVTGVVDWFKTMTTNSYIRGVSNHGWPQFEGRLWQRSFYDHVIRNEQDLLATREYILTNPLRRFLIQEQVSNVC